MGKTDFFKCEVRQFNISRHALMMIHKHRSLPCCCDCLFVVVVVVNVVVVFDLLSLSRTLAAVGDGGQRLRDVATSTAGIKAGVDEQRTAGRTRTASSVGVGVGVRVRVRVRASFTQVLQFSTSPGIP